MLQQLSTDIITRVYQITEMKVKIFAENPLINSLIIDAFLDVSKEIEEEIEARRKSIYAQYMPRLFENLDFGVFKPGIDPSKALELITIVAEALSDRYIKAYKQTRDKKALDLNKFNEELGVFLEMLKKGIYRDGSEL